MQSTTSGCVTTRTGEFCMAGALLIVREKDLQRQVTTLKDQLRDLHTSNESTQAKLLDASQRQGELPLSMATDY